MKYIIVDKRENFRSDIMTRALLMDEDVEIVSTLGNTGGLHNAIGAYMPDAVVIADNILEDQDVFHYGNTPILGYATSPIGVQTFADNNIACYGIISNTTQLINLLAGPMPTPVTIDPEPQDVAIVEEEIEYKEEDLVVEDIVPEREPVREESKTPAPAKEIRKEVGAAPTSQTRPASAGSLLRNRIMAAEGAKAITVEAKKPKDTKVITVFSAKGGVGKTTIAVELASHLALNCSGRERNRVCIVDYNIDFGDVRLSLGDPEGGDMTLWAIEIQGRIDSGEDPASIVYTKEQMSMHLTRVEASGLYALLAPASHDDSWLIKPDASEVMLRNLVQNGDFDYIVCDTGNNTRDTTFTALEQAHHVLMVLVQDTNTVNCNHSFLCTVERSGFELDKIQMVINRIVPAKNNGITTVEIREVFDRFDFVGEIADSPDVVKANNFGNRLVYKGNSKFAKDIQTIAKCITSDMTESIPTKKGRFSLFRRK